MEKDIKTTVEEIIKSSRYETAIAFGEHVCEIANSSDKPFDKAKEMLGGDNNWGVDEGNGLIDFDYGYVCLTVVSDNDGKMRLSPSIQFYNWENNEDLTPTFLVDIDNGNVESIEPSFESFKTSVIKRETINC